MTYELYMQMSQSFINVSAEIDIDPNTLNLKSNGKWVSCYIELPEGHDVNEIDISTVNISDINGNSILIHAESHPTDTGDHDGDGIPDLMVKFDRQKVQNAVGPGDATITVEGEFGEGFYFKGFDTIRVIKPGKGPKR